MRLATDAGLLVAAERRMRGVGVVAVRPDPSRLDGAAHPVAGIAVARPNTRAETVERVVGDRQRFGLGLEGRHREHGPEDLLLEDAHLVVALEQGRLHVVAARKLALHLRLAAAGEHLGAFLLAEVEVGQDLGQLLLGGLRAEHRRRVERVALLDRRHTAEDALHETVIDRFVDDRARRAGADLALVEREQHHALDGLVEEIIVFGSDVGEEHVRRLAA